jgi:8-oxo-dGTP diphosphatase
MARRYCVECGTRLRTTRDKGRRVPGCPACGWIDWNNPAPTASVLVMRAGRVLLVRRAFAPARGAWDVPGGFVERGESAEAAGRREAREELGVDVALAQVVGIFPDRYGPKRTPSLNIYYLGRLRRPGARIRAGDDAAATGWFPLHRVPDRLAFKNNRQAIAALRRLLRARPARRRRR